MAKIIFTSRYLRDAPPAQLENYVRYVGTREGVEKIDESKLRLPATVNQRSLIRQLIRDIPASKDMLEYADFLSHPTIGNASEFISCALEQNLDLVAKKENYVDYIANRPRVERIGEHGLFTDAGKPVVLAKVQNEVADHKGPVWTHVFSLRREDAARLGYDSAGQWMALLRSKRAMLCKHMKIDSANLRWYAAFHNEGHHPHVHLMVYSAKDNDGFLTEPSIKAMRSELAHDIFRQDFANIYEKQNHARVELKAGADDALRELLDALRSGTMVSPRIAEQMELLASRLQNTSGKKVYGYLKRDVKNLVNQIVDELAKDSRVDALYQAWGKWQNEILLTYQKTAPPLPPLSQQKQFKSIKNMVIAEAMKLGGHHFTFEDEGAPEPESAADPAELVEPTAPEDEEVPEPDWTPFERESGRYAGGSGRNTMWSDRYKKARLFLFGGTDTEQYFEQAFALFLQEAESGNPLAMHDLGRMFAYGLGREIDSAAAQEWYAKALAAFQSAERTVKEKQRPYLQYRIGKMYAADLGTEQDYEAAARWFGEAVTANHKYAQYSLAGLYYRGQGVEQSYGRAFQLYGCSAAQKNPYASYELAKMYRDGIDTEKNMEAADKHFMDAFNGFFQLEKDSHDDKLQYRLGQMLHTGTGTEQDDAAAADYLERSAKLGNVNAQYALAKLYLAGEDVPQDIPKAVELFRQAADQENQFAQYQLGKLYLSGEHLPKDVDTAIHWLEKSAMQENQFAQYALGKLYLCGHDVPRDKEKAVPLLEASAAQGNIYAQFLLDHIDSFRDPSPFLAATRLLHRLENLFREDIRKAAGGTAYHIDRKRRRRLAEKKQAQGHKRDDREPVQQQTY
uniref:MobP3 family relaxase n=1 Tax=Enterocloster clostridioformis TaxID=1531 RepID=UPI0026EB6959|nr:MobP3 family relaxase [Enterocloster clostridioformis]